jgi:transcriptional regulator with XRE-family HTH domain
VYYRCSLGSEEGKVVVLRSLRSLREKNAMTQQELAERAEVSRGTIIKLESGSDAAFPSTVRKLAAALGVEPVDLMTNDPALRPLRQRVASVLVDDPSWYRVEILERADGLLLGLAMRPVVVVQNPAHDAPRPSTDREILDRWATNLRSAGLLFTPRTIQFRPFLWIPADAVGA